MSQQEKARYFRALKEADVLPPGKHYREYTTEELKQAYDLLVAEAPQFELPDVDFPDLPEPTNAPAPAPDPVELHQPVLPPISPSAPQAQPDFAAQGIPRRAADPEEMAGQRLNSKGEDEPIRVDEHGRLWFQEEIRKPAFAKPRGRRVLQYMDSGTTTQTVRNGEFTESFEVAGTGPQRVSEVKVTLPSYQVGIFKDPRFPFKVHTYNGAQGFDLFEVQNFYGGAELVPTEIKRMYVENVLCYDIRTVVRAIETEYRRMQLAGKDTTNV